MRLTLDESLGRLVQECSGRQVMTWATVGVERLFAATDRGVIEACQRERRCLLTLDLDFGSPLVSSPRLTRASPSFDFVRNRPTPETK